MNLLELLQKEIADLKLTDLELIARYIYIRTGEILEYNPAYDVASKQGKRALSLEYFNIKKMHTRYIICHTWSTIYRDLLLAFGIKAIKIRKGDHSRVLYQIKNDYYMADMTTNHEDIYRIKFGLETKNNYKIKNTKEENNQLIKHWDEQLGYIKGMRTETALALLKKELQEKYPLEEDYLFQVYQIIQSIINIPRNIQMGNVSGRKYIRFLLQLFLEDKYQSCTSKIYNLEQSIYIQAYGMKCKNQSHFYFYQEMENGNYELQEISFALIEYFEKSRHFNAVFSRNLRKAM